jgi:hypothetical protein
LQLGKVFSGGEECIRFVVQDEALIRRRCRTNFATNAPYKSQIANLSVELRRKKGGHQMRRERRPTNEVAETIAYTFHFQITNKGGRQACSVSVQAPNIQDATTFFRQNWPMIESMARDGLVGRSGDDRAIKLTVP